MRYIFQQMATNFLSEAKKQDLLTPMSKRGAREWFRSSAREISKVNAKQFMSDTRNLRANLGPRSIGKLYMFYYEPKHRAKLPYYDSFPLVYPISFTKNGFLGLNLHYLPPYLRSRLMDSLYTLINNEKMDGTSRLRISYQILKSSTRFRYFRPCVKSYLFTHVHQKFLLVPPQDWDKALLLPTERFKKRSKAYVWSRSEEKL